MKKILLKPKTFLTMGALSLVMIVGISVTNYQLSSKQVSLHKINNGIGICFQRVTQTFTALMIRDFNSEYLNKDFRSMSSECLSEVTTLLSSIGLTGSVLKMSNNLKSDLHWFDQKIDKVKAMAMEGDIDLTQSNITRKYSELESLKSSVEDTLLSGATELDSTRYFGIAGIVLGQLALLLSFVAFMFHRKLKNRVFEEIEEISLRKTEEGTIAENISSISHKVLEEVNLPNTKLALENFHDSLIKENIRLEDSLLQMSSMSREVEQIEVDPIEKRESVAFGNIFNSVLDRVHDQAFAKGIFLDTDITDDFKVYSGQEVLEQLLFSLTSFSLDSALSIDGEKRVTIRSKSLGGIAYCKVRIENYSFSEEELNILNGKDAVSDTSVNLLLLRELVADANGSIAVKNKQNSQRSSIECEIEIVFERAMDDTKIDLRPITKEAPKVKIVKGNRKQIRDYFQQNI